MAPLCFPHGRVHADLTIDVGNAVRALGSTLQIATSVSVTLEENSLPEADIVVVEAEGFEGNIIDAAMVRLVIEVSASSLRHDLGAKLRLYASTSIPEYWVADVLARRVVRLNAPVGNTYAERAEFAIGEAVPSATIPGRIVDTAWLA